MGILHFIMHIKWEIKISHNKNVERTIVCMLDECLVFFIMVHSCGLEIDRFPCQWLYYLVWNSNWICPFWTMAEKHQCNMCDFRIVSNEQYNERNIWRWLDNFPPRWMKLHFLPIVQNSWGRVNVYTHTNKCMTDPYSKWSTKNKTKIPSSIQLKKQTNL